MVLATLKRSLIPVGALVASAALVLVAASPAQAAGPNHVVNGNFARPAAGFVDFVPNWQVLSGSGYEVVGSFTEPAGSAAGTQSVDLNPDAATTIHQDILTTPGTTYVLSFDLAGNPNGVGAGAPAVKTGTFQLNGANAESLNFDTTGRTSSDMGWVHKSLTFTAQPGRTTSLTFISTTPGEYGPVITNVSVVEPDAPGGPLAYWPIALVTLLALAVLLGVGVTLHRRRSATTA